MYTIDGVPLSDPQYRWRVHRETQRRTPVAMRSIDTHIPGVNGSLPIYGEDVEATALGLELNVYGTPAQVDARCGFLRGLLGKTHAPLVVRRRDGLEADAKTASISDPVMTDRYARISATLTIPAGVWRGPDEIWEHPSPLSTAAVPVPALDGGSRPITDARILITGPATTPELEDEATGATVRFTGDVPAGQALLINTGEWRAGVGSSMGWTSTSSNATSRIVNTGPHSADRLFPSPRVLACCPTSLRPRRNSSSAPRGRPLRRGCRSVAAPHTCRRTLWTSASTPTTLAPETSSTRSHVRLRCRSVTCSGIAGRWN